MPERLASGDDPLADAEARIAGLEERIAADLGELSRRRRGSVRGGPPGVRYLFVCGCPRSGTTSLATLLNADERFIIGQERYRRARSLLEPFLFREELFFNPTERETSWATPWRGERVFPGNAAEYRMLRERWRDGGVLVLGDKAPYYHRVLGTIAERFDGARIVFVLRELPQVARSYRRRAEDPRDHWPSDNDHRAAVAAFNQALTDLRAFVEEHGDEDVHILRYEEFHAGAPGALEALYAMVGLEPTDQVRTAYATLVEGYAERRGHDAPVDDEVARVVEAGRDRSLERWAHDQLERQRLKIDVAP